MHLKTTRFINRRRERARLWPAVLLSILCSPAFPTFAQISPPPDILVYQPTNADDFFPVAMDGFGDPSNNWASAMKWFKGHLYVATAREVHCAAAATLGNELGFNIYPFLGSFCPLDPADLPLAAEIWRYDPQSDTWDLVFQSPEDIPVRFDLQGNPTKFTARDINIRDMVVFQESDGTEALYASGVSPSSVFGPTFDLLGHPAPRILRTVDGVDWEPLPQDPGTFLGDITRLAPVSSVRPTGFRSLVSYKGMLIAEVTNGLGMGMLLASPAPQQGGDAWFAVSPPLEESSINAVHVFNDYLYVSVGSIFNLEGYSIFKTDAEGPPPFALIPIVLNGGYEDETLRPLNVASFREFNGKLFVGTTWPAELIRINKDDSWDLMMGEPRQTSRGLKTPWTGLATGLGSAFSNHIQTMAVHEGRLYAGTVDWSVSLFTIPTVTDFVQHEFGFDLFRTDDGFYWNPITKDGFGSFEQYGAWSLESTPFGLFVGTATGLGGTQVWQQGEASTMSNTPPPECLAVVSEELAPNEVILSWEPSPDAMLYHVYRSEVSSALSMLPIDLPVGGSIDIAPILLELLPQLEDDCASSPILCRILDILDALETRVGLPGPFVWVGATPEPVFIEETPSLLQSIYLVRAEDAEGQLSLPSNIVGGPSKAPGITYPLVDAEIADAMQKGLIESDRYSAMRFLRLSAHTANRGNLWAAQRNLEFAEEYMEADRGDKISDEVFDEIRFLIQRLKRNLWLSELGLIQVFPLL
jgi:hypothetical protein